VAVVTARRALLDTQHAFDGVAAVYDDLNAANPLLCAMRARSRAALEQIVAPGFHILDLGCGPGTDAVYFAKRGYHVTAIDWSPAMVAEARRRVEAEGLELRVHVEQAGIDDLYRRLPQRFDAIYSSFGPLNCVADLDAAAVTLAGRLRPTGVLVASVIGRICPWEIALYLTRGEWARAAVRFSRHRVPVPLEGRTVWTQYYAPGSFERAFRHAGFERLTLRALGVFTPPPYMRAFAERRAAFVDRLQRLEDAVGGWPGIRACGDHFLTVMRRT
jgi:SAM-dependent methyltransferase